MKTVETVMLQTLLSAKNLATTYAAYDFTGKAITASEFFTMVIMTHPAKDNILAILTDTFDFNRVFPQVAVHPNRTNTVCEFVSFNPLNRESDQITVKYIKDKTGWYANETNAISSLKYDSYSPQSKPSSTHQFFAIGQYTESTDTISTSRWLDWCESSEGKIPTWYTDPDTEAIVDTASQEIMDFRASQNLH